MSARRFVGAGQMRRGGRSVRAAASTNVTNDLSDALGSLAFAFWPAFDPTNITAVNPDIVTATGVSSWPDAFGSNAALVQATGSKQPALSATGFNSSLPGVTSDGTEWLLASLSPTIAQSSRFYFWMVGKLESDLDNRSYVTFAPATWAGPSPGVGGYTYIHQLADGNMGYWDRWTSDDARLSLVARDTNPHQWEHGLLSVVTDKLVVDGTGYDGGGTPTNSAEITRLFLFRNGANETSNNMTIHSLVVAHDTAAPTSLPSASQISDVRSILNTAAGL